MRIIAIANQKGGCGKTTTAINLTACLALKGQRSLLIDCDPQAHATLGLNAECDSDQSMYHVMTPRHEAQLDLNSIIRPIKQNFDLAPSSIILGGIEQELAAVEGRENMLRLAIEELNKPYDYIILDCPPSLGHMCFNALRASEEVIIPIDMSLFSLRGVAKLSEIILLFKTELDHNITSRALVTMYDFRTRYSRQVLERVKEEFGANVLQTVIRYNIRLRETVDYGLPVGDYDKHAIGQKDYEQLTAEVMAASTRRVQPGSRAQDGAREIFEKSQHYIQTTGQEIPLTEFEEHPEAQDHLTYAEMLDSQITKEQEPFSEETAAGPQYHRPPSVIDRDHLP